MPLNIAGEWIDENKLVKYGLPKMSTANLDDESYVLIVHAVCVVLAVLYALKTIMEGCEWYVEWRKIWLSRDLPENYFALFRKVQDGDEIELPKELKTVDAAQSYISKKMNKASRQPLQPGVSQSCEAHVRAITMFVDVEELQEIAVDRDETERRYENAVGSWKHMKLDAKADGKPAPTDADKPSHRQDGTCCCGGTMEDTAEWCLTHKKENEEKLSKIDVCLLLTLYLPLSFSLPLLLCLSVTDCVTLQPTFHSLCVLQVTKLPVLGAGVVGFSSIEAASVLTAEGSRMVRKEGEVEIWPAPAPHDVHWEVNSCCLTVCSTPLQYRRSCSAVALSAPFSLQQKSSVKPNSAHNYSPSSSS